MTSGFVRRLAIAAAALALAGAPWGAVSAELVVGVSWANFQEERWKTDAAALEAALALRGARYLSADAQSSPQTSSGPRTRRFGRSTSRRPRGTAEWFTC